MAELKSHQCQYWLNAEPKDEEAFRRRVVTVCECYRAAPARQTDEGVHTGGVDEETGIPAPERTAPTKPRRPDRVEKEEFEDKRHSAQPLIDNVEVATGRVTAPTVQATRGEQDFARHIGQTIATDPDAGWTFVADNLTTHCSEALVLLVAGLCASRRTRWGVKGKRGY